MSKLFKLVYKLIYFLDSLVKVFAPPAIRSFSGPWSLITEY